MAYVTNVLTTAQLHEMALAVAMALPGFAYSVEANQNREGGRNGTFAKIVRTADGLTLGFWKEQGRKSHVEATYRFDTLDSAGKGVDLPYDVKRPEISFDALKATKTIVADITRRLLPQAETLHVTMLARLASANVYEATKLATEETLLATGCVERSGPRYGRDELHVSLPEGRGWGAKVQASSDVALELHGLSPLTAASVLRVVVGGECLSDALYEVLEAHDGLCMDNPTDRATLALALVKALGGK